MDIPHFAHPFHLVSSVGVASTFWLLQIVAAMIFRERLVCGCVCVSILTSVSPAVQVLGPIVTLMHFLRKCRSIFQKGCNVFTLKFTNTS